MNILHAHWQAAEQNRSYGELILWAERDHRNPPDETEKQTVPDHPFCLSATALADVLKQLGMRILPTRSKTAPLWLPSTRRGPDASPGLPQVQDRRLKRRLSRWTITGLTFTPVEATTLLLRLADASALPPSIKLGHDFRFWQTATNFALEALAQQKVMPGLFSNGDLHARWLPVFDGPNDGPRLQRLQSAMPPLCRAGSEDITKPAAPATLLKGYLVDVTDALFRSWTTPPGRLSGVDDEDTAQRWLAALFSDDGAIAGSAAQLERFEQSYQSWLRNLQLAGNERFRVAFRLEEPPRNGAWTLHFLLQARDDPSLLLPAGAVWHSSGEVLSLERFEGAQEKLLAGLGYASQFSAPIRTALEGAKPERATLSAEEAFAFLRECAPLLEESGFGVLIPPWWTRPSARLGLRLRLGNKSSPNDGIAAGIMRLRNLVRYRWELSLGEASLSREEFEALVALKSPLVLVRGEWVRLDPEQVEAAVRFFEKRDQENEVDLLDAMHLGLGRNETVEGLPVEDVHFEGELASWLERLATPQRLKLLPQPEGLQGRLRPYQRRGFSWLEFMLRLGLGACLADDMGLGKTLQALTLLLYTKEHDQPAGPWLLICPTSVVNNWQQESERFAPELQTLVHQGPRRLQGHDFQQEVERTDLVLTSYSLVRRDAATLQSVPWYGVILDEAQNIKNPESHQSKAVFGLSAQFRMALTGTPVENRLAELWSLMNFLNPGYLGTRHGFKKQFATKIEREQDDSALKSLRRLTMPFILCRLKTDKKVIRDLPEKTETKAYCYLSEEQASLYETVVRDALGAIEGSEGVMRKGLVLSMMMRLKQICNHPAQYLHEAESYRGDSEDKRSGKLQRLIELLEETLSVNDRSLIFTQFTEMGDLLVRYLSQRFGIGVQFLHGGTPAKKRSEMVRLFQKAEDGPSLFILSLKAGGTGLNLTRATHVFHFDRWWNPAVENQATDRAFRIGQKHNVQVHKFVCTGTLEERIDEMIETKKALAGQLIEEGESWVTELSTEQLHRLVSLRREALS
jgi:SNF2 family DNA or RNA helicase